jgi:hypothetical protein
VVVEMEVVVRGAKKYKALRKLLEVASGGQKEFSWSDLVKIMVLMGISHTYSNRIITELTYLGVLNKVGDRYVIDVEKLREIVESVE